MATTGEKIAQIIASRDPLLKEVRARRTALQRMSQVIRKLEDQRQRMDRDGSPFTKGSLNDLDLKSLKTRIDEEYQRLEKPESRFKRSTLNIGVLGYARQGKSTFLRSVSGLNEDVIPTGSEGACTGTRSLIIHDDNPSNEGATVHFYTEREFLEEVLAPYYEVLPLKNSRPYSLDEFAFSGLPDELDAGALNGNEPSGSHPALADMYKRGKEVLQGIYAELLTYYKHIGAYRQLFDRPVERLPVAQIRSYIAQQDLQGNPLYNYLAVKEAVIRKNFGNFNAQQVGLLDIPGLGGLRIADQQRFIRAIEKDIDIILFFNKPSAEGADIGNADLALYALVNTAFEGLSLHEGAFAVINHRQSLTDLQADNGKNCKRLQAQIDGLHMVQACYIVDCSKTRDTQEAVFLPILEYLKAHMVDYHGTQVSRLDNIYMRYWDKRYEQLRKDILAVIQRITPQAASDMFDLVEEKMFKDYFPPLWIDLASALEDLLRALRAQSQSTNNTFSQYFQERLILCRNDTGIEPLEKLKKQGDAGGGDRYVKLFSEELDHVRTRFTGHFDDLDRRLQMHVREVKKMVAEVFLEKGRLRRLYPETSPEDLFQRMAADPALSPHLQDALKKFVDIELKFGGYLQTLIHSGFLNIMVPDTAIMRYLVSNYVAPRLTHLHKQFKLSADDWLQLMNIILTLIINATLPNPLLALITDVNAMIQLDESVRHKLIEAIKSLFFAETQTQFTVFQPQQIFDALHSAHRDTLNVITQNLQTFYSLPGRATVAAVQDFVDQVLRVKGIESQWDTFYRAHKSAIWSVEFSQIRKWQGYQQQWQTCVAEAVEAASHL